MIIASYSMPYRNRTNTNFSEQVSYAKSDGFSAYEFHAPFRGHCSSGEAIAAVVKAEMTVSVHANFRDNDISSLDPGVRDSSVSQTKEDILFAEAVKARVVVVHPGRHEPGCREAAYGQLNESLQELLPFAREHNILFTLENMDGTENKLFSSHRDVEYILALHPTLQMTLDFAHLGMTQQDITRFLNDFAGRIAHFHISGSFAGRPHTAVALQESETDFGPYLKGVRDWDMIMTIENADRLALLQSRAFIEQAFSREAGNHPPT